MIYVNRIRTSLKGGADAELGQRTVIVGPNGSGKCLPGWVEVYDPDRGETLPISQFVAEERRAILGVEKGRVVPVKVKAWHRTGKKPTVELQLNSGVNWTTAASHPILTDAGCVRAEELRVGSWVAEVRSLPRVGVVSPLSKHEALLAGLLVGDGCVRDNVELAAVDTPALEAFRDCIPKVFPGCEASSHGEEKKNHSIRRLISLDERKAFTKKLASRLAKNGVAVRDYFESDGGASGFIRGEYAPDAEKMEQMEIDYGIDLHAEISTLWGSASLNRWTKRIGIFGPLAGDKRLPKDYMNLDIDSVRAMVSGLWMTDGYVSDPMLGGFELSYTSKSEKLVYDIRRLLLRIDVQSNIRRKKGQDKYKENTYYTLIVLKASIEKLHEAFLLGDMTGYKLDRLRGHINQWATEKHNPNHDLIPSAVHKTIGTAEAWRAKGVGMSREKFIELGGDPELADNDIRWSKVKSITRKEEVETYDVSLDNEEMLYVADTFIVHNSTLVQAFQLSTQGWVTDMEGRAAVKNQAALGRLFPQDGLLFAEATLSDGRICEWKTTRGKDGSVKKPTHTAPVQITWPIQELQDTLTGEATSVQAWLEQQVVSGQSLDELLKPFPASVRDIVQRLWRKHKKADFVALAKEAKSESKALKTQATKLETTILSMTEGVSPPLSEQEEAALRLKLAELQAPNGYSAETIAVVQRQLDTALELYSQTEETLAASKANPEVKSQINLLRKLELLTSEHLTAFGSASCQLCGSEPVDIKKRFERISSALKSRKVELDAELRRETLETSLTNTEANIRLLASQLKAMPLAAGNTERDDILTRLAHNSAVAQTWTNAVASKREVFELRAKADAYANAAKALETTGKEVIARCKVKFEQEVTAFLPAGEAFEADLDSARFGLRRDNQIHSALSGAEWTRVLLALAASRVKDSTLCVLAPEDRAWSGRQLTQVMLALATAPTQIILMSTVKPDPTPGWVILSL